MTNKSKSKRKTTAKVENLNKSFNELSFKDNKRRLLLINELLKKCTYYTNNATNSRQLLDEHKDIDCIVNDIITIERDKSIELPKREQNWLAFKEWLNENNIDMSKVDIDWIDESHGFGLKAIKDIKQSEIIIEISRKVMISCETALKSDPNLASFIREDPVLQHMPNIALALHVIDQYCRTDSFWKPYLQCLPSSYNTVLYLSDEDINQLKGSQALEEVIKMKRSIARQFAYFSNQFQTNQMAKRLAFKDYFTYELYRWAVSTVMTRQNAIPSCDGQSMITALIPLWDMCNHRYGKLSTDYDLNIDSGVCRAMDDFNTGQQIFIYYGQRSNGDFFVHNGFVYKENINDFVPLRLGMSKNDPLFQQKYELCKKLDLNVSGVYRLYNKCKPIDQKLLAFLRVFHFNKAELDFWLQNDNISDIFDVNCQQLMHLNDKIQEFLSNRSVILLKGYPKPESQMKYNQNIEQLIESEINLLKSYIL